MATNLSIDPELLNEALRLSGESTKQAAVTKALIEFVARRTASSFRQGLDEVHQNSFPGGAEVLHGHSSPVEQPHLAGVQRLLKNKIASQEFAKAYTSAFSVRAPVIRETGLEEDR